MCREPKTARDCQSTDQRVREEDYDVVKKILRPVEAGNCLIVKTKRKVDNSLK
jgi:hypothetical protein